MASTYITITTENARTAKLMALTQEVLDVSQKLAQTKAEMDAIMGNPVDYAALAAKYGVATDVIATNLYNMVVAAKSAMDAVGITQFTKSIGL